MMACDKLCCVILLLTITISQSLPVSRTVKYGFSTTNGVVVRSGSCYYFNVHISETVTESLSLVVRVNWKKTRLNRLLDHPDIELVLVAGKTVARGSVHMDHVPSDVSSLELSFVYADCCVVNDNDNGYYDKHIVKITDHVPVVDFSSAQFTGTEDDGKVEVTLFTTMPANIDIPITLIMTDQPSSSTSAAALRYIDYDAASITTTIHIGEEETSVIIHLYSDCENETTETFTVNFTIPELLNDEVTTGLVSIATVNIINSPNLVSCDQPKVVGDPHFVVPLISNQTLCYSIQGYTGLAFNLISNEDYVINAMFTDSEEDATESTWIGKLAVIPRNTNTSQAVLFDSTTQEVNILGEGTFKASMINQILFKKNQSVSFKLAINSVKNQKDLPAIVNVVYDKPKASFTVHLLHNKIDVDWNMHYEATSNIHGLMGQFMAEGVKINPENKLLFRPRNKPVAVTKNTSSDILKPQKSCWHAVTHGNQGEGLIEGKILDYTLESIMEDNFTPPTGK